MLKGRDIGCFLYTVTLPLGRGGNRYNAEQPENVVYRNEFCGVMTAGRDRGR